MIFSNQESDPLYFFSFESPTFITEIHILQKRFSSFSLFQPKHVIRIRRRYDMQTCFSFIRYTFYLFISLSSYLSTCIYKCCNDVGVPDNCSYSITSIGFPQIKHRTRTELFLKKNRKKRWLKKKERINEELKDFSYSSKRFSSRMLLWIIRAILRIGLVECYAESL